VTKEGFSNGVFGTGYLGRKAYVYRRAFFNLIINSNHLAVLPENSKPPATEQHLSTVITKLVNHFAMKGPILAAATAAILVQFTSAQQLVGIKAGVNPTTGERPARLNIEDLQGKGPAW